MTRAAVRSTASRLLNFSLWAAVVVGLSVVAFGLWVMAQDARVHGEDWDGLGLLVGRFMVAGGLLWSFPHVILALWLVWARRRGRSLALVGTASAVLAGGLLFLMLGYAAVGGAELNDLLVPIGGCTLVLVAGVLVVADRSP
jgi:hypothetical protein